ncbi:hypothetical protein E2C01_073230 [Portunus trituberculatus]|uniref:Uncharacterized protein n=1 Tax=Portunus trituberculatus TaxID=210409 RepID=A0A5B7I8W4_PORTR|nr:hypothetical protein [Portunus trituberculatus]
MEPRTLHLFGSSRLFTDEPQETLHPRDTRIIYHAASRFVSRPKTAGARVGPIFRNACLSYHDNFPRS